MIVFMNPLLERALVRLRIALNTPSKLKPTGKRYAISSNFGQFDAERKRRAGVCNMFANIEKSVDTVAHHYKLSRRKVVRILLEEGYLEDQRKQPNGLVKGGRRETDSNNASQ
jgi:hypothetical protein